jgi:hypothetical protein
MRFFQALLAVAAVTCAACHPGPAIGSAPKPPTVDGTIAGIVSSETKVPLPSRKVTAINTQSGARFDTTTGSNGGYTLKVPPGTYRLEVELQPGETVAKHPGETRVNTSDLDPHRHFVIAITKRPASGHQPDTR